MSGATFPRIKNWNPEILTNTDLNAEIDNILNNLGPAGIGAYSDTAAMMKLTTDPGEAGSESLATALSGELERLRFAIKEIKGTNVAQWYSTPTASLTDLLNAVGGSLVTNRIVSGASSTASSAPRFLIPSGGAATLTLDGTPTSFVYYVNGVQYTISSDITLTSLASASATNNTAAVNDATLTAQESSKWQGEDGTILNMTAAGTGITNLSGTYGAFKVVHGGNTEYFIAYVASATQLTNVMRGYFLDSTLAPVTRTPISNGDTITLMNLTWVFATTAGALAASYVNPTISNAQPSSTLGYWYDITNATWKSYNGSSWVATNSTLIGICAQDTSNCKIARAFNFYGAYDAYSSAILDYVGATSVIARNVGTKVGVGTSLINFMHTKPTWDIATALESGFTESASTTYFVYLGEAGQLKLSPNKPYLASDLGRGWYHPYENWRSLGSIQNNSSSDFDPNTVKNYAQDPTAERGFNPPDDMRNIGISASVASSALTITVNAADGSTLSPGNPGFVSFRNTTATSGIQFTRRLISNLNITVPTGASLGHVAAINQYVWGYLIDNAGICDFGVMGVNPFPDNSTQNYTAISSGATNGSLLYATGSGTSKAVRLAAQVLVNEAGAGTWATTPATLLTKPLRTVTTSDWATASATFTPNGFGTITNSEFFWRRVGDTREVRGYFTSGTLAAAIATLTVPDVIDSTKISPSASRMAIGDYYALANGGSTVMGANNRVGAIFLDATSTASTVWISNAGTGSLFSKVNASTLGANTDGFFLRFSYPVSGWSTYGP